MSVKKITPTFQMVLNKQIGDTMDAINEGNLERAYEILQTLIDALKEEDSDPLLNNDVKHINSLLEEARKPNTSSFYRGLLETTSNSDKVLLQNIRSLFRKIMRTLHKGNYLVITRKEAASNVPPEFFDQLTH